MRSVACMFPRMEAAGGRRGAGLSSDEAAARLARDGENRMPGDEREGWLEMLKELVSEPMLILLMAAAVLYLILGDLQEALIMLGAVLVVIGIELYQEGKTERALDALRDLSSPRARVWRDGSEHEVDSRQVVVGDLLLMGEGDRVAADVVVREARGLEADESLLTGESVPVRKRVAEGAPEPTPPGGDDQPFAYAGTLVVRGDGVGEVVATAAATRMGRIGASLSSLQVGATPLQEQLRWLVWVVAAAGLVACLLVVVGYGLSRGDWLAGLLAGIALAMSALPEEFAVVFTVFMALGAYRMSRAAVLTRRTPVIEALGQASVLCADKTGTVTENRMRIAEVVSADGAVARPGESPLAGAARSVVDAGVAASPQDPIDPMERAFVELAGVHDRVPLRTYPLTPELLCVAHVYGQGEASQVYVKGAPETVLSLCGVERAERERVLGEVERMAAGGLRVLATARGNHRGVLPEDARGFELELLGLVGLADPIRPRVPPAVAECYAAGMRVMMITGDYPVTARAIGAEAGLDVSAPVLTGAEIEQLDDADLAERLQRTSIVARAVPNHKLRIVEALRARGEVVVMTGDGVNDAPARKAAHVGVAMGGRGTEVAREASDLVVTDDDFGSIVEGVRMGRRIFDNLRRATAYIVAVHVPVSGLALYPVLQGWELVLLPIHIIFLEFIIDPTCSLVFESEPAERGVMGRPPRPKDGRLLTRKLLAVALLQGLSVLAASIAVLLWARSLSDVHEHARTLAFTCLVSGNLGLIMVNRSFRHTFLSTLATRNVPMWSVLIGASLTLSVAVTVPTVRDIFHLAHVGLPELSVAVAAGLLSLAWLEAVRPFKPESLADAAGGVKSR